MAVLKATPSGYFLWDYIPSRPAAICFAALFFAGTVAISWQSIRTRTKFAIPFIIGGMFEVGGYAARAASQDMTDQLAPYIAQYMLILVAPGLFAASVYMILGRVILSVQGEAHSPVAPRGLTRTFVWGDVLSFLTQVAGGSLQSMKKVDPKIGERVVLGGLVLQILVFAGFAAVALVWHRRMRREPTAASASAAGRWESVMLMLYGVGSLVMVRCVFRVLEYGMGRDAYLLRNEWTMFVFDSALMVVAVGVFAWWYPGRLPEPKKGIYEQMEGGGEV
ncbi:hypothetical protein N3K66_001880 [Trichothecium roseum]|uniref:Uncharacterized protein n=1 Tax=Trichothecium roseum TaxID=47278 RepID=A0ACC0VAN5_9HYPO|nr:hypothetical protein N3K66_001880 [Trichothecium roseum]